MFELCAENGAKSAKLASLPWPCFRIVPALTGRGIRPGSLAGDLVTIDSAVGFDASIVIRAPGKGRAQVYLEVKLREK